MNHSQIISTQINQTDSSLAGKKTLFTSSIDGISVRINVDDWDRLAVSFVDIEATATKRKTLKEEQYFIDRCSSLAERLTYLEESLNVVEVDRNGRIGIIRSCLPLVEDSTISYFEIEVNGKTGKISLKRVTKETESGKHRPRKTVLGYRLLGRLIDNLSSAVQFL